MSNYLFPRPSDPMPVEPREPVAGRCEECDAEALQKYPVLSEGGWFLAVKCQACLHSNSREKWHRLGHVRLTTDTIA